jgi:hypothetical protein
MTEFRSSWLVQRLERPLPGDSLLGKDNPFSFGGGIKNGGLSDEAMKLLRGIFSFDYMGAAEFEWGAVPEALSKIARSDLVAFWFNVPDHTIFVLAPAEWRTEVEARIREFTRDYGDDYYHLKESTLLHQVLYEDDPKRREFYERYGGWLELNNGFLFFTDEEMWAKTCDLFEVEHT